MYFLKRLAFLVPLLLVISFLAFGLMRLAPGGPFDSNRAPASPEIEKALKAKYRLDQPRLVQYWFYLRDLAHGDLGLSTKYRNHTVNDIVADALPVSLSLGVLFAGKVARLVRESMTTTLQSEFIIAARAKGLGESAILYKHALRLALLPIVSFSAPMLADLLTGSFVVESIFQIPGLGAFFVNSSINRDYPLLMGLVLLYAGLLLLLNLLADFALAFLDRRVRYE